MAAKPMLEIELSPREISESEVDRIRAVLFGAGLLVPKMLIRGWTLTLAEQALVWADATLAKIPHPRPRHLGRFIGPPFSAADAMALTYHNHGLVAWYCNECEIDHLGLLKDVRLEDDRVPDYGMLIRSRVRSRVAPVTERTLAMISQAHLFSREMGGTAGVFGMHDEILVNLHP